SQGLNAASWSVLAILLLALGASLTLALHRLSLPSDGWLVHTQAPGRQITFMQELTDVPSPIKEGDVLVAVEGRPVETIIADALALRPQRPPNWEAGGTARYTVLRAGREVALVVPLVTLPVESIPGSLGANFVDAPLLRLPSKEGVRAPARAAGAGGPVRSGARRLPDRAALQRRLAACLLGHLPLHREPVARPWHPPGDFAEPGAFLSVRSRPTGARPGPLGGPGHHCRAGRPQRALRVGGAGDRAKPLGRHLQPPSLPWVALLPGDRHPPLPAVGHRHHHQPHPSLRRADGEPGRALHAGRGRPRQRRT